MKKIAILGSTGSIGTQTLDVISNNSNEFKIELIDFKKLDKSIKTISLEELLEVYPKMLKGETSGRYIIDLKK